jgi:hypothetical protein
MASAMHAAVPVLGIGATLILAASALAAGASSATPHPRSAVRRPHLVADVRGRRGLVVPLAPFAGGDVQQRTISLHARGRTPITAVALTVIASDATPPPQGGFQVRVDRCPRPWSSAAAGGLRCRGGVRTVLGWHPVQGRLATSAVGPIRRGRPAWLRVSVRLPAAAGTGQEGRSLRLRYRFTAA